MTEKIVYQFDAYCKRNLQNEKVDYYRQKRKRFKKRRPIQPTIKKVFCIGRLFLKHLQCVPVIDKKTGQQKVDKQNRKQWKCNTVATTDWNSLDNAKKWRAE